MYTAGVAVVVFNRRLSGGGGRTCSDQLMGKRWTRKVDKSGAPGGLASDDLGQSASLIGLMEIPKSKLIGGCMDQRHEAVDSHFQIFWKLSSHKTTRLNYKNGFRKYNGVPQAKQYQTRLKIAKAHCRTEVAHNDLPAALPHTGTMAFAAVKDASHLCRRRSHRALSGL